MNNHEWLAERFQENRGHLRAVAYRMLGSLSEADDAVQESWLKLSRSDTSGVENLGGWLTTVVARVCLDMLRSRKSRREEPLGPYVPEPIVSRDGRINPEHEVLLADSVGLALLVVLETLAPDERLAFVLHDMFGVPFDEIASTVGALKPGRDSSRAGPDARCRERPRFPTPIAAASEKSSTPSSLPRAAATSTRFSRCSIQTSCYGPTAVPRLQVPRGWSAVRGQWPDRPSPSREL
jgi:RNA polymerase sigma factor (sigma-70 family)